MERPYEQIRQMVKLFEYNRLKLRFRNEDERARFIDGWAEHFCETDDAEWNIAVTIMTARRREPNFYNMEKAMREAQGIRRERVFDKERKEKKNGEVSSWEEKGYDKNNKVENENNALNTADSAQKRALHMQGSYNLKATPKTPEEIAQEALLRYERRGRG